MWRRSSLPAIGSTRRPMSAMTRCAQPSASSTHTESDREHVALPVILKLFCLGERPTVTGPRIRPRLSAVPLWKARVGLRPVRNSARRDAGCRSPSGPTRQASRYFAARSGLAGCVCRRRRGDPPEDAPRARAHGCSARSLFTRWT